MNLSEQILEIILTMRFAFAQQRSFMKFTSFIFAILCTAGRHTITSLICFLKQEDKDWSSTYRFFNSGVWDANACFDEVLRLSLNKSLSRKNNQYILISIDDFRVEKVGKTIPHTRYQLDPKSPPFHPNLMWGHRYLHATIVISRKKRGMWQASKSISIKLELAPHVKKPGKRATEEEWEAYEKEKKEHNLTQLAAELIKELRRLCDEFGYNDKDLIIVADGGYCNKRIFSCLSERIHLVLRCRKDAKLCERSKKKRKFYEDEHFTPHGIYKDEKISTQKSLFFYGRKNVNGKFKEKKEVYWQRGAQKRELRCLVVFGMKYRKNKNGNINYREPMYLLTTHLKLDAKTLIQLYLYRWEIEVTHRELKNDLGISQAQVWNELSVERCPKIIALANSIIHLAKMMLNEDDDDNYLEPPKWYKKRKRISLEYLRRRLREEIVNSEFFKKIFDLELSWESLFGRIAA